MGSNKLRLVTWLGSGRSLLSGTSSSLLLTPQFSSMSMSRLIPTTTTTTLLDHSTPCPCPASSRFMSYLHERKEELTKTKTESQSTSAEEDEDLDKPIKFTTSKAAQWRASQTHGGPSTRDDVYQHQQIIIAFSLVVFLLYFAVFREESDVDEKLGKSLFEQVPALKKQFPYAATQIQSSPPK